ncbi:enoyl-CoA hydratase-related protein [Micromonospora sp. DR5-3]|uniref:enoyl-CoA hydratase/isomerase family protein n=1 Tax=unclassified Micromonospora TaxID=2617518 RepID=UPI001652596D|nr:MULTISPECIES: enoyl-CoA hydratase-related protein [unclassified Micromonospora]MCW3817940.1 enoyl-CoA hydratase-related protein [Micromonospora sp. DR5-3]
MPHADATRSEVAGISAQSAELLCTDDAGVRCVTLSHPTRRNALDDDARARLLALLQRAFADPAIRVLVITGAAGTFSAGGDLRAMSTDPAVAAPRLEVAGDIIRAIAAAPIPVLTAVEGQCYGFGLALAAASDHIIAGATASFCCPFPRVGLAADGGLHHTLAARVGRGRAAQMLMFAEPVDTRLAAEWGLIDQATNDGEALPTALERARTLTARAPLSLSTAKRLQADLAGLDAALRAEATAQLDLITSDDFAEGVAAFLAKRPATFHGR